MRTLTLLASSLLRSARPRAWLWRRPRLAPRCGHLCFLATAARPGGVRVLLGLLGKPHREAKGQMWVTAIFSFKGGEGLKSSCCGETALHAGVGQINVLSTAFTSGKGGQRGVILTLRVDTGKCGGTLPPAFSPVVL